MLLTGTAAASADPTDTPEAKEARIDSVAAPDPRGAKALTVVAGSSGLTDTLEVWRFG